MFPTVHLAGQDMCTRAPKLRDQHRLVSSWALCFTFTTGDDGKRKLQDVNHAEVQLVEFAALGLTLQDCPELAALPTLRSLRYDVVELGEAVFEALGRKYTAGDIQTAARAVHEHLREQLQVPTAEDVEDAEDFSEAQPALGCSEE